jgi:histidine ammonia-lyase
MELLAAAQGLDFLRPLKSTAPIEKLHREIRKKVRFAKVDRSFHEDLIHIEGLLESYALTKLVIG